VTGWWTVPEVLIPAYSSDRERRIYHGNHDCRNRPGNYRPEGLLWLYDDTHDWDECDICQDEFDSSGHTEKYQYALKDADTLDEISLDGEGGSA